MSGYWIRHPALLATIATCAVLAAGADVFVPVFVGRLIDAASGGAEAVRSAGPAAVMAIVGLGLVNVAARDAMNRLITRFTLAIMTESTAEAFRRVQRFSSDWHASTFAGSTVRKITRGMWAADGFNDVMLLALLPSASVLSGTIAIMAWHRPLLGAAVALGAAVYVSATVILLIRYNAPAGAAAMAWDTRIGGVVADAVSCNQVVKSFGAETREEARLEATFSQWRRRTRRHWLRYTDTQTVQLSVLLTMRALVVGGAVALLIGGAATAGEVAYTLTAFFTVHGYLRGVSMDINNLQRAVNDMEEMIGIHDQPIGIADMEGAPEASVVGGMVVFDRVDFRYGSHATPLYDKLSVAISAGERVGLVGRSGSGKTTFVKLIQRLHDVTGGRIAIDGIDIATVTQRSLRASIAVVQQEPLLFHRSLAENIAYGRPGATMEEIRAAATFANADEFIMRLPKGYATMVGERGVKLSGGERQRVAIARAFLTDAPILVMDEATSSLDSESEHLVQQAMERLMTGRTSIVIAHRLSTVRAMDRILVFDKGRIAEEGTHDELARAGGIYASLFERQAFGAPAPQIAAE